MTDPLTDSATVQNKGMMNAVTTDSYVVDPLFFPGGNIGKLAVCGTVNDLAVSGAYPEYIAVSFIIEEGFPVSDLEVIAESMASEASKAGVRIVTGDTKVVDKGKCDKIFITTAGTGYIKPRLEHIATGKRIKPGDKLIINGPLGNHAIAVLGARNNLSFSSPVISDCASLNHMIHKTLDECDEIHFMRDLTRGGLAAVLNELKSIAKAGMVVNEVSIPVDDPVKGVCEVLGFDPLYLANEGKVLIVAGEEEHLKVLEILKSCKEGTKPAIIGEIVTDERNLVILSTSVGGKRIIDMPAGVQLPRIC